MDGQACAFRHHKDIGKSISFKEAVTGMLEMDPTRMNGHYRLQSHHCQLNARVHEYNVVGVMDKATHDSDADCLLEQAGLSQFAHVKPPEEAYWNQLRTNMTEASILQRLFTKDAARALIKHFKEDYATFHFPVEPAWLQGATGEWYDLKPDGCKRVTELSLLQRGVGSEDEEDIVGFAAAAGYPVR